MNSFTTRALGVRRSLMAGAPSPQEFATEFLGLAQRPARESATPVLEPVFSPQPDRRGDHELALAPVTSPADDADSHDGPVAGGHASRRRRLTAPSWLAPLGIALASVVLLTIVVGARERTVVVRPPAVQVVAPPTPGQADRPAREPRGSRRRARRPTQRQVRDRGARTSATRSSPRATPPASASAATAPDALATPATTPDPTAEFLP
jgi:hypothetical protein